MFNYAIIFGELLIISDCSELCPPDFKWSTGNDCYLFSIVQKSLKDAMEYCKSKDSSSLSYVHHYLSTDLKDFYASIDYTHTQEYLDDLTRTSKIMEGYIWNYDKENMNNSTQCFMYHTLLRTNSTTSDCKKQLYFLCKRPQNPYTLC